MITGKDPADVSVTENQNGCTLSRGGMGRLEGGRTAASLESDLLQGQEGL